MAVALIGIGFWVGVIYLFTNDIGSTPDPVQTKTSLQPAQPKPYTPPDWSHIDSVRQAETECPANHNICMLHGVIAEWGSQCKQWILLETDKSFTAKGNGDIYELFNTRLIKNPDGQYILRGIEMKGFWDDGLEYRYEYGCRIDPVRGIITGIAPPEPIYTQNGLRFKDFN
jgi:hypothetical protein